MLFNMNKKSGLMLLKLFGILMVLLIPSLFNEMSSEAAVYTIFAFTTVVFVARIRTTAKMYLSVQHFLYAVLLGYGILSVLWAKNPSQHFTYLVTVLAMLVFSLVIKDYFTECNTEGFGRRFAYFLHISGTICAIINIVFWFTDILPFAKNIAFKEGMGTSDFLGIFMALSMLCTGGLYKNNSGFRKILIATSLLMMLFVFFMAKSVIAWFFLAAVILLLVFKSNTDDIKRKFYLSFCIIVCYFISSMVILGNSIAGKAFDDVFAFSLKNFFGAGGGFWSGRETFSHFDYSNVSGVGLFPYVAATAGIIGVIIAFVIFVRSLVLFIKLKNTESVIYILLLITLYMFPFAEKAGIIFFLIGLNAYNEHLAELNYKYDVSKDYMKKISIGGTVGLVLSVVLAILSVAKMCAFSEFKQGKYAESYELYNTIATVNFMDSDSKKMAALSICKDSSLLEYRKDEALDLIGKAIKSDRLNISNIEVKARIYFNCEEYELCSEEYRKIIKKAVMKDKYNLALAESLQKTIENSEKGSSDAKRCYEEMMVLAQDTKDLDYKEKISDLIDISLEHTKGEFESERQEDSE